MDGSNMEAVTAAELRAFIERIEQLRAEQAAVKDQEKEVFAEMKGRGYMTRPVRTILKQRAMRPDALAEEQAVLELYKAALGPRMKHVILPWPYDALWPNARPHWAQKAKAVKAYRFAAKSLCLGAKPGIVRVTFCPKSRGPLPDRDNCIAAFKAAQDGIADAMGVNDRDLIVTHEFGDRCKDGGVIVEFLPLEASIPFRGQIS